MFGQNPIRHATHDPLNLAVESIFYTIQGEGPYAGIPALFIRLAGCNLACHFCDTQFETHAEDERTVEDLITSIELRFTALQRRFVVVTGGEPMRQQLTPFFNSLLAIGTKLIQIETAGTLWQDGPDFEDLISERRVVLVCSPKTPKIHPEIARYCRHWKYVITAGEQDSNDGLPNRGTQTRNKDQEQILYRSPCLGISIGPAPLLNHRAQTIWVSPCDLYDPVKNRANLDACRDAALKYGYRISLQTHKILGVE